MKYSSTERLRKNIAANRIGFEQRRSGQILTAEKQRLWREKATQQRKMLLWLLWVFVVPMVSLTLCSSILEAAFTVIGPSHSLLAQIHGVLWPVVSNPVWQLLVFWLTLLVLPIFHLSFAQSEATTESPGATLAK